MKSPKMQEFRQFMNQKCVTDAQNVWQQSVYAKNQKQKKTLEANTNYCLSKVNRFIRLNKFRLKQLFSGKRKNGHLIFKKGSSFGDYNYVPGTGGNDNLVGTNGPDFIVGNGGNDTISSLGGNDCILTQGGNDTINSGNNSNVILAGAGVKMKTCGIFC